MREAETMRRSHSLNAPPAAPRPSPDVASRPATRTELTPPVTLNIALRALMELGIVLALGIWGYHAGSSIATKLLLAIVAPVIGFGFWGAVDFHQLHQFHRAGRLAEPLRLLQELAISALAGLGLFVAGRPTWGFALLALSALHHVLVYALGQRLIEDRTP